MTTTKHTPGPWEIGDIEDGWVEIDSRISNIHHLGLAKVVWKMEDDEKTPRCEANARLIAAAPEMLEALEFFVERFSPVEHELIFSKRHALQKARAAIAKATGENQLNRP